VPTVTATVLEVGPAAVRRTAPLPIVVPDATLVAAALQAGDDAVVLLDECTTDVPTLWRSVIGSAVDPNPAAITVVVPSWWPRPRVGRIIEAAATVAADVVAMSRSQLFAHNTTDDIVVIEIADEIVAVTAGESIAVLARSCTADTVARAAIGAGHGAARVVIDTPVGVVGVGDTARGIRSALEDRGVTVVVVEITDLARPADTTVPAPTQRRRSARTPAVAAAASVAVVMCAMGIVAAHQKPAPPNPAGGDGTNLVEGRITVRIPLRWNVTRVTAGPGSRRVQVTSVTDHDAALHITQSYVPGETLGTTSEVMARALAEQPAGVFVDYRPRDQRAGRPAVTYREVRDGRDIWWVVLVDGATRISIGCQSAPGREDAIAGVCDEAVRSAREVTGTPR